MHIARCCPVISRCGGVPGDVAVGTKRSGFIGFVGVGVGVGIAIDVVEPKGFVGACWCGTGPVVETVAEPNGFDVPPIVDPKGFVVVDVGAVVGVAANGLVFIGVIAPNGLSVGVAIVVVPLNGLSVGVAAEKGFVVVFDGVVKGFEATKGFD